MGSWHTYHLTVHPGERDPERVAAELRSELPDALVRTAYDSFDLDDIVHGEGPAVWVADGLVHFATGRNWRVSTFDWSPTLVPALPVPARWACAVWQQEVEYNGGADLFGWVDGGFVPVDEQVGQFGTAGADALAVLEREWGVTGSMERDVPQQHRADADDPVADPESVPGFEPVDRDALGDPGDALATLADTDRAAETRRRAAERLYVHVAERDVSAGLDPRLFAALDDDATKWAAGATVRDLSVPTDDVERALAADDVPQRRAGARFCSLRAYHEESDTPPDESPSADVPTDALSAALSDPDPEVRRLAARAFERSVVADHADPPTEAFDALVAATDDGEPAVRAAAAVAIVRTAFDHEAGDFELAAEAFAAAAFDPSSTVRDRLDQYLDVNNEDLAHFLPDALVTELLVALSRADIGSDVTVSDPVEGLVTYPAYYLPWVVDPVLADLVELGWAADSALARKAVTTYVDGADDSYNGSHDYRGRLGSAFAAAGVDPDRSDVPELPDELLSDDATEDDASGDATEDDAGGDATEDDAGGDATGDDTAGDGDADAEAAESDGAPKAQAPERDDGRRTDADESSGLLGWLPFR